MRGLVVSLAALGLLIAPAAADAGTRDYKGRFQVKSKQVGAVRFELRRNALGERRIAHWRWRGLPIECGGDSREHSGYFVRPWMRVDENRSFHGKQFYGGGSDPDSFAEVNGQFSTWADAGGTFRVTGTTGIGQSCESGEVGWTAKRLPRTTTGKLLGWAATRVTG